MSKLQAGDIFLFKGERGFSWLIAWGTNSLYSHCAICVSPKMNLAIEAIAGHGVRARDTRKVKKIDIYRVKEEYNYDLNKVISFLVDKLNMKYDYLGVIYLGLLKLGGKIFPRLKVKANKWQKDRDYFCFELCSEAFFKGGGLNIVPNVKFGITSGKDIAESKMVMKI